MPDNEIDDFTFWDACGREAKKNPAPGRSHGNPSGASGGGDGVQRRKGDKEEVRQLTCSYSLAYTSIHVHDLACFFLSSFSHLSLKHNIHVHVVLHVHLL